MREPRKRQQAAAAARNNVAPVERSTNLMDMPLDEFQGALAELAQQGVDTDALLRQYRAANSPFAAVNRAVEASSAELAAAGRRPVSGSAGLLSRSIDDAGGVRFEPAAGLLGMLAGVGRQIDAPMAAYQELIPAEDMDLEALGTAGVATLGGGAVTRPAGSFGMGGRVVYRGDTDSDQRISGGISEGNLFVTPYEDIARLYGDKISQFNIPSTARVLVEGTPEFAKITGRRRGPLLRTMRQGENLVQASTDAVNAAKAAGYDAVEFNSMRDLGISIINPDILAANASPEAGLLSAAASRLPPEKVNKDVLDPFGYASNRLDDYLDNTQLGLTDLGENLPRVSRSWEDLEGGYVLPLYGDRTSRGYNLESINDTQFSRPVYTEGGSDFMRGPANQQDDAVWASAKHIIDRINNAAIGAARLGEGRPIYGVTGSMAPNGVDFANMTGEAMAELVMGNRGRIDPAAARVFDDIMMNRDAAYPGLLSDELRNWAGGTTSETRKSFIRGLDTKPMRGAGVPSAGLARYGVTDPTLRDVPSGQFGSAAAQLRPESPLLYNDAGGNAAPRVPHSTYNTQLLGDYVGELPLIPQGLLFRDAYDRMSTQLDKRGMPLGEANKTYAIKTQLQPQLMTPEVVDGIMQYLSNSQGLQ